VFKGDETRCRIGGKVRNHFCLMSSQEVVPQDEEVTTFYDLEAVCVRVSFDGEDDGDCP
jgi:hypothetical protein